MRFNLPRPMLLASAQIFKSKNMKNKAIFILILLAGSTLSSCKKSLEIKSNQKLAIPTTLADFQALLDNYNIINGNHPASGEVNTADYYLTDGDYLGLSNDADRRMYTWQKNYVFRAGDLGNDWNACYTAVYYSNTVLTNLNKITKNATNATEWDNVKGQALFHRAYRFFGALQIWTLSYDPSTAAKDLGIPLRLTPDFNEVSTRASIKQSCDRIISDLKSAVSLLPVVAASPYRPGKAAAYASLARAYLYMRNYPLAGLYADSCLQINSQLIDINSLKSATTYPITKLNQETIFYASLSTLQPINNSIAKIDPHLYDLYNTNDLRRILYFKTNADGSYGFRGSYTASFALFGGIATDEMYLIRAECNARQDQLKEALKDLNMLLSKRFKSGTFIPIQVASSLEALDNILKERRKELVMRGLRWGDIKRLNKEQAGISLIRAIAGNTYTLQPNDSRYALPIPEDVISTSGMQQN